MMFSPKCRPAFRSQRSRRRLYVHVVPIVWAILLFLFNPTREKDSFCIFTFCPELCQRKIVKPIEVEVYGRTNVHVGQDDRRRTNKAQVGLVYTMRPTHVTQVEGD